MSAPWALTRKLIVDSRWMLGLTAAALFWLSWLFVFVAARTEQAIREQIGESDPARTMRFLRGMGGGSMDFSTGAIEMAFWNHPMIILMFCVWAISRGTAAVAGEIDRGTLDMVLSRPITRTTYLLTQASWALFGLAVLGAALVAGNQLAHLRFVLNDPPGLRVVLRPAINLAAIGFTVYGYALFLGAVDIVRWRPIMIATVATLAGFILHVVANIPSLEEWKWMDKLSIFKAYNPVELVVKGDTFAFNTGILSGIGAVAIALALIVFNRRDLPTNS